MIETTERYIRIELERLTQAIRDKGYPGASAEITITADRAKIWLRTAPPTGPDGPRAFQSPYSEHRAPYLFIDGTDGVAIVLTKAWVAVEQMSVSDSIAAAPWFELDQGPRPRPDGEDRSAG